jgi:hypothetical protein
LSGTNVFRSPTDPNKQRLFSYAINDFLIPHPFGEPQMDFSKFTRVPSPSETVFMAETQERFTGADHFHFADPEEAGYSVNAFPAQVAVERQGSLELAPRRRTDPWGRHRTTASPFPQWSSCAAAHPRAPSRWRSWCSQPGRFVRAQTEQRRVSMRQRTSREESRDV